MLQFKGWDPASLERIITGTPLTIALLCLQALSVPLLREFWGWCGCLAFAQIFLKHRHLVEILSRWKNASDKCHKLWDVAARKTPHVYLSLLLHHLCLSSLQPLTAEQQTITDNLWYLQIRPGNLKLLWLLFSLAIWWGGLIQSQLELAAVLAAAWLPQKLPPSVEMATANFFGIWICSLSNPWN